MTIFLVFECKITAFFANNQKKWAKYLHNSKKSSNFAA